MDKNKGSQTGKSCAVFQHNPDSQEERVCCRIAEVNSRTPPQVSWTKTSLILIDIKFRSHRRQRPQAWKSTFLKTLHRRWMKRAFCRDMAGRDGRGENEFLLKTSSPKASEAYSNSTDTKTLTLPSWSDDKGKIAVALLTKPEIVSFWPQSLEGLDGARESRKVWEWTWTLHPCATLGNINWGPSLRQRLTRTCSYMAIALVACCGHRDLGPPKRPWNSLEEGSIFLLD